MMTRHRQRGQALFETTIFLPLMLLAMSALIFFSQYGVLQERAALAVRYASLVSNNSLTTTQVVDNAWTVNTYQGEYGMAAMFNEIWREGHASDPLNPGFPYSSGYYTCSGSGATQALYQSQSLPSGSVQTAPPYFQSSGTPSATCTPQPIGVSSGGTTYAGSYFLTQYTSISATKTGSFLRGISQVNEGMPAVPGADPTLIVYCSQSFTQMLSLSFQSPLAGGSYGSYQVPSGGPTTRPGC